MRRRHPFLLTCLGIWLPLVAVCGTGFAREPLFKPIVPAKTVPTVIPVPETVPVAPEGSAAADKSTGADQTEATQTEFVPPKSLLKSSRPPLFKPPVVVKTQVPAAPAEEPTSAADEPKPADPSPVDSLKPAELQPVPPPTKLQDEVPPPPGELKPEVKPVVPPSPAPPVVPQPVPPTPAEELPATDPLHAEPMKPAPIPVEVPLGAVTTSIMAPTGRLPLDRAAEWTKSKAATGYLFAEVGVVYYWDAPNFCYQPLYFEQPNVERLGYSRCAFLQPATSGIQFFAQTLALPYQMTVHPYRRDCIYPLGHYRPGSPVPFREIYPEWNARAAAVQAAATTGLIFVLP